MTIGYDPGTAPEQLSPTWPGFPTTSTEFITLIAHYYRAEIARMAGWRDRIDRTTNWAITVVGAMLSISLSTPTAHHGVILFAMVLVLLLLVIESRRYGSSMFTALGYVGSNEIIMPRFFRPQENWKKTGCAH